MGRRVHETTSITGFYLLRSLLPPWHLCIMLCCMLLPLCTKGARLCLYLYSQRLFCFNSPHDNSTLCDVGHDKVRFAGA